jgi:hypothetical protein
VCSPKTRSPCLARELDPEPEPPAARPPRDGHNRCCGWGRACRRKLAESERVIDTASLASHRPCVGEAQLRIGTARLEDAECVSRALSEYDAQVEAEDGSSEVVVVVAAPVGAMLGDLLTALKACPDENEIASVEVTVDAQSYVMVGTS